jgi:hypothetical protein
MNSSPKNRASPTGNAPSARGVQSGFKFQPPDRSLHPLTILIAFIIACVNPNPCLAGPDDRFTGKYLLFERPADVEALDGIEFLATGICRVDQDDRAKLAATYHTTEDGRIFIESKETKKPVYEYRYESLKQTIIFSAAENVALIYAHPSDEPHPKFAELVGIFLMHSDAGDSATEITADSHFRAHLHDLVPENHTYFDIVMDGRCTYSDGVVTYLIEHSNAPQRDKYIRDFILKRDDSGVWELDPIADMVSRATPCSTLDLPPVPKGYQPAKEP